MLSLWLLLACAPPADAPAAVARAAIDPRLGRFTFITAEESKLLLRHLQASPAWEVRINPHQRRAFPVALLRAAPGQPLPPDLSPGQESDCTPPAPEGCKGLTALSFGTPYVSEPASQVALVLPTQLSADLPLFAAPTSTPHAPRYRSALRLRGPDRLLLEIVEESSDAARSYTTTQMKRVEDELTAVVAQQAALTARGYLDGPWMPPGGVQEGEAPAIEIRREGAQGPWWVSAWLNPGEQGVVWVEVHPDTTKPQPAWVSQVPAPLSGLEVQQMSSRQIGFGPPPARFPYQAPFQIQEGSWSEPFPARLEIWFEASETGIRTQLAAQAFEMSGR